jgi:membrane AbrB-like protein
MNVFQTLIIAFIGGIIGMKLKLPGGAFLGAMAASAIFNIVSSKGAIPYNLRLVAQIIIGGYVGLSFTKDSILQMKEIIIPIIAMVMGLFLTSILLGLFLHKVTNIDLLTAMLGSSPGGLTEMSIIADSYGADVSKVAIMHLVRLVSVVSFLPMIVKKIISLLL